MDLTEIITQTPAIGAILIIVAWFLRALAKHDVTLRDIAEQGNNLRRDAIETLKGNSEIVGQNSELLREVTTILRNLNGNHKS